MSLTIEQPISHTSEQAEMNEEKRKIKWEKVEKEKHIVLMFGFFLYKKVMFLWMQKKKVLEKSLIATFCCDIFDNKE